MRLVVRQNTDRLEGAIGVPASELHLQRALILASLAPGMSRIIGRSDAGRVRTTIAALRALGTRIEVDGAGFLVLGGDYRACADEISVGASVATLHLLTGLTCLADAPLRITGQSYLARRPIAPLLAGLQEMGLSLRASNGQLPIMVRPRRPAGGHVRVRGDLAGWVCGLLMLAPFATGPTVITVVGEFNERAQVELTIRMMRAFGLEVGVASNGRMFTIEPNQEARPAAVAIPPDLGAAAFGLAAAALHPADVVFPGLAVRDDVELLRIVGEMGVPVVADPVTGWARVRHDGIRLMAVRADCCVAPELLPVLAVLGALAEGTTCLDNVAHVGFAEPDRLVAMSQLNRMGAWLELNGDQLRCHGVERLTAARLSSFNDHRALMALALAGSVADGETWLTFPNAHRASYPGFVDAMCSVGLDMARARDAPVPVRAKVEFPVPSRVSASVIKARRPGVSAGTPTGLAVTGPDRTSLALGGSSRTVPWLELDEQVDRAAALLVKLGVQPGESVALHLPDQAEFVALAMAVSRIGANGCPVLPMCRRRENVGLLRASHARVLVVSSASDHRYALELAIAESLLDLAHIVVLDRGPSEFGATVVPVIGSQQP